MASSLRPEAHVSLVIMLDRVNPLWCIFRMISVTHSMSFSGHVNKRKHTTKLLTAEASLLMLLCVRILCFQVAAKLGMQVIVVVSTSEQLKAALNMQGVRMVSVNQRNLANW